MYLYGGTRPARDNRVQAYSVCVTTCRSQQQMRHSHPSMFLISDNIKGSEKQSSSDF